MAMIGAQIETLSYWPVQPNLFETRQPHDLAK